MQSMGDYYSAVQLRSDRWSALREKLDQLEREPEGRRSKQIRTEAAALVSGKRAVSSLTTTMKKAMAKTGPE